MIHYSPLSPPWRVSGAEKTNLLTGHSCGPHPEAIQQPTQSPHSSKDTPLTQEMTRVSGILCQGGGKRSNIRIRDAPRALIT